MAKYIEFEAALRAIENKRNEYVDKAWKPVIGGRYQQDELFANAALGCRAAEEELKTVPAADVVEVVRCKDCIYWRGEHDICTGIGIDFSADGFCCEGKRKTDG